MKKFYNLIVVVMLLLIGFLFGYFVQNNNFKYRMADVRYVLEISTGIIEPQSTDYKNYDINEDGIINSMDAKKILNIVNGKSSLNDYKKHNVTK